MSVNKLKDGDLKQYYGLTISKIYKDGKLYYDRAHRGKSWFYVDLRGFTRYSFVPSGSTGLLTADNKRFKVSK